MSTASFAAIILSRSRSGIATALVLQLALGGVAASVADAASPAIGIVRARGAFRVNDATVTGNGTLTEGATIETNRVSSALEWTNGARLTLAAGSKGRVYGDHMVLERGQGQMEKSNGFHLEAGGLTIQPETGNATGRVMIASARRIQVSAVTGSFRVLNLSGLLVARLPAGAALALEPQVMVSRMHISGRLDVRAGHYTVTDQTTRVTIEVVGPDALAKELEQATGKRVDVSGTVDRSARPFNEASHVLRASKVTLLAQAGGAAPAATGGATGAGTGGAAGGTGGAAGGTSGGTAGGAAAAGTAGAGTAGGGIGTAATIATIGGVAAAGTVGGLVASGAIAGEEPATVSR